MFVCVYSCIHTCTSGSCFFSSFFLFELNYIYIYIYIFLVIFLYLYCNSDGVKETLMIQFVNKKYYTNWYLGKKFNKKKKLKTSILLENNQPALQCLAKRKHNNLRWNIKLLNTLSRAKLECSSSLGILHIYIYIYTYI